MKKWMLLAMTLLCVLFLAACREDEEPIIDKSVMAVPAKPVIYLYPETETQVTVELDFNGTLTSTYPAYANGWRVIARPDGTLTDDSGRAYYCLFWEGETAVD